MATLQTIFYVSLGLASLLAAAMFAFFTVMTFALMVSSWFGEEFSFNDRCWITLAFSLVVTWGCFLTYQAATHGWIWSHYHGL